MNFKDLSHIIIALPPLLMDSEIEILSPSAFAKDYLYYLLFAQTINAQFPFYLECAPFDAYMVIYTTEGEGKLLYEEQTYYLRPNSVVFIDCHQPFRLDLNTSSYWNFKLFVFNGSSSNAYYNTYHQSGYCVCELTPLSNIPPVTHKLLQTTTLQSSENTFIISKLLTDLLTELILAKDADICHPSNFPKYLLQIKELFDLHYKEHFNLDDLAQTYHVSKYKIIRDFSTYLHNSPINYLIEKRISAAKHLLLETDYPIYEIASSVGIDNINHFTNLFKKSTHLTPNSYRKTGQLELTEYLDE